MVGSEMFDPLSWSKHERHGGYLHRVLIGVRIWSEEHLSTVFHILLILCKP